MGSFMNPGVGQALRACLQNCEVLWDCWWGVPQQRQSPFPCRGFSLRLNCFLPPPPAHAAPGWERPSALQSARKQTSSAEEEARAHPATAPTSPAQVPRGGAGGPAALGRLQGGPVKLWGTAPGLPHTSLLCAPAGPVECSWAGSWGGFIGKDGLP